MENEIRQKQLPEEGACRETILQELEALKKDDIDWKSGKTWSMVYYVDEPHLELIQQAHNRYFSENAINPFAFKGLRRMEEELISIAGQLLHGDEDTVGTISSGGTESIILAVYTYREWARRKYPRIREPEIVAPASIHPAFSKACHLLNIQLRKVKVGDDFRANVEAMEKQINKNTILIAGSAPVYPNGIMDPIERLGALAEKYNLPLHVDACVGGFMLPWVEELGYDIPAWDFRIPAVTSISADLHKFAYGAKGASTLLYRQMDHMRNQFFISTDWCGGIYASTGLLGTRAGGPIAAAWAAMRSMGRKGYRELAGEVMKGVEKLASGLRNIPEIEILGSPCMNILAYTTQSNQPDIFVVADQLEDRGWMVDRQQRPNSIHLTIMPYNLPVIEQYLGDLEAALEYARSNPKASAKGNAALYGLMARIPMRGMVENNVRKMFESVYGKRENGSEESQQGEEEGPAAEMAQPGWMGRLNLLLTRIFK